MLSMIIRSVRLARILHQSATGLAVTDLKNTSYISNLAHLVRVRFVHGRCPIRALASPGTPALVLVSLQYLDFALAIATAMTFAPVRRSADPVLRQLPGY